MEKNEVLVIESTSACRNRGGQLLYCAELAIDMQAAQPLFAHKVEKLKLISFSIDEFWYDKLQRNLPLMMFLSLPAIMFLRRGEIRSTNMVPSRWSNSCCITLCHIYPYPLIVLLKLFIQILHMDTGRANHLLD